VTGNVEDARVDTAYQIPGEEALPIVFDLLAEEGLCVGGSTGINVAGAIRLALEPRGARSRRGTVVPMAFLRVSHVGLCVADLERSLRFWRDGLGFRERSSLDVAGAAAETLLGLGDVKLRAVYLERDGLRLELLHFASPGSRGEATLRPMNELGLTHLSVRVDDLDAALARLAGCGGRVLAETRVAIPAAKTRAAFVLAPDGTRVELVEAPGDPGALPGK
jgi:lactoylglutathione lyase